MATTTELVDELVERFHGWNTDGPHGVLRFLDQAQSILLAQESHQRLKFDPTTGRPPILDTTEGVFEYQMDSDIWRVGSIMVRESDTVPDYGKINTKLDHDITLIGGIRYKTIKNVRSWDWQSISSPARIMFTADPLTRSNYYYIRAWVRPTPITAVTIQHSVTPPNDILYLLPAAALLIEGVQNGTLMDARRIVEHEIKPKLWAQENKGEQSDYIPPVDRGF